MERCPFCDQNFSIIEIATHCESCNSKEVKCESCGQNVDISKYQIHLENCQGSSQLNPSDLDEEGISNPDERSDERLDEEDNEDDGDDGDDGDEFDDVDYDDDDGDMDSEFNEGLDKEKINSFPVFNYSSNTGGEKNCNICLNDYSYGENLKMLTCLHKFHSECIDQWLNKSNTCPLCKYEFDQ